MRGWGVVVLVVVVVRVVPANSHATSPLPAHPSTTTSITTTTTTTTTPPLLLIRPWSPYEDHRGSSGDSNSSS